MCLSKCFENIYYVFGEEISHKLHFISHLNEYILGWFVKVTTDRV